MPKPRIQILSNEQIATIHEAALQVLRETGVQVHHEGVRAQLHEHGARVDAQRVRLTEDLVMRCVGQAGKSYVLHGRDRTRTARFGHGDLNLMSSPGQHQWLDADSGDLRPPTLADMRSGIRLGDALPNVTIVGALAQPGEMPPACRDVLLAAELARPNPRAVGCKTARVRATSSNSAGRWRAAAKPCGSIP